MEYHRVTPLSKRQRSQAQGFSLVELVIVVVIIGIVAAIAVPRISSAGTSASANALEATLTNVRKAIDIYYAEHSAYPGYVPVTGTPNGDRFKAQLTLYSDAAGNTSATKSAVYKFGPYLRAPFPTNKANNLDTVTVKANTAVANPTNGSVGWIAVLSNGDFGISATTTQLDNMGITKTEQIEDVRIK